MATIAIVIQLSGSDSYGPDAVFNINYAVVDSVQQVSLHRTAQSAVVPTDSPGSWKDIFIQAVIDDALINGITLTSGQVYWINYEPGDFRYIRMSAAWTKDITKTNIGTASVNVYTGQYGEPQVVDFGGFSQYKMIVGFNKIGTGNLTHGLYHLGTETNKMEAVYTGAAGEGTSDTGWLALPSWAKGEKNLKPMAKSSVAADDPLYRNFTLYLR